MTNHPDTLPDDVGAQFTGFENHLAVAESLSRAGVALKANGSALTVYVPDDYDDEDLLALANQIMSHNYIIQSAYPAGDEFALKLSVMPLQSTYLVNEREDAGEVDDDD